MSILAWMLFFFFPKKKKLYFITREREMWKLSELSTGSKPTGSFDNSERSHAYLFKDF